MISEHSKERPIHPGRLAGCSKRRDPKSVGLNFQSVGLNFQSVGLNFQSVGLNFHQVGGSTWNGRGAGE